MCAGTYALTLTDAVGCTIDTSIIIGSQPVYGCTDPIADNYDSSANTDDGSCFYCDLSVVTVISLPNSSPSACDGIVFITSLPLSSYPPITYLWSTGSTQSSILGLCSGTYTLTVTDAVGCSVDTSIIIAI